MLFTLWMLYILNSSTTDDRNYATKEQDTRHTSIDSNKDTHLSSLNNPQLHQKHVDDQASDSLSENENSSVSESIKGEEESLTDIESQKTPLSTSDQLLYAFNEGMISSVFKYDDYTGNALIFMENDYNLLISKSDYNIFLSLWRLYRLICINVLKSIMEYAKKFTSTSQIIGKEIKESELKIMLETFNLFNAYHNNNFAYEEEISNKHTINNADEYLDLLNKILASKIIAMNNSNKDMMNYIYTILKVNKSSIAIYLIIPALENIGKIINTTINDTKEWLKGNKIPSEHKFFMGLKTFAEQTMEIANNLKENISEQGSNPYIFQKYDLKTDNHTDINIETISCLENGSSNNANINNSQSKNESIVNNIFGNLSNVSKLILLVAICASVGLAGVALYYLMIKN